MKYVKPLDISGSLVLNYNSVDSTIPEYDALKTNYVLGDIVKVALDKKKYKLASATVAAGIIPKDNPTIWSESTLSEYAMFNHKSSNISEGTNGIKFSQSGAGIDTIYLQDIDGTQVIITEKDSLGAILFTHTVDIAGYDISSFGDYLFQKEQDKLKNILINITSILADTIDVEITGNASCRYYIAGQKSDSGYTLANGINYNVDDFFKQKRDSWGDVIWGSSRTIDSATIPVIEDSSIISINIKRLKALQGYPVLFIADDREQVKFDFINIFGRLINVRVSPLPKMTTHTLQIEGM